MATQEHDVATQLREWMWAQRPPLNGSTFSQLLGLGRSTVAKWLSGGTRPTPDMLALIAQKTGIPLERLLRAAGYPVPNEIWDFIVERLESNALLSVEVRDATIRHIQELKAQFDAEHRDPSSGTLVLLPEKSSQEKPLKPPKRRRDSVS